MTTGYLSFRGRERMSMRGVSQGTPEEHILSVRSGETVLELAEIGGGVTTTIINPVLASSFLTYSDYGTPLLEGGGRLWVAGSAYDQMPFKRNFFQDNLSVSLLLNKREPFVYF